MRILLASQFPLSWIGSGSLTRDLAIGLTAAGHQVHVLSVEAEDAGQQPFPTTHLVCDGADGLGFPVPVFVRERTGQVTFDELSGEQVARYREGLRRMLDEQVEAMDPHIIHGQHAWLLGELILETGAPYVLSGHRAELNQTATRFRPLAEQAAENAGRLLVGTHWLRQSTIKSFHLEDRTTVVPRPARATGTKTNGPRAGSAHSSTTGKRVVCFSDLGPESGTTTLLNAAARYELSDMPIETVVIGEGIGQQEFLTQSSALGLRLVQFAGHVTDEQQDRLLQDAAVAIVAQTDVDVREAIAVQCLSAGVPVLVRGEQGLDEIVDSEVGLNIGLDDNELLTDVVLQSIEENWKAQKGAQAKARAIERHSIDEVVRRTVQLYEEVLRQRFGELPPD